MGEQTVSFEASGSGLMRVHVLPGLVKLAVLRAGEPTEMTTLHEFCKRDPCIDHLALWPCLQL